MRAECEVVANAATDATYTCSGAFDSDVSACKSGFYEDASGTADLCTGELSPPTFETHRGLPGHLKSRVFGVHVTLGQADYACLQNAHNAAAGLAQGNTHTVTWAWGQNTQAHSTPLHGYGGQNTGAQHAVAWAWGTDTCITRV